MPPSPSKKSAKSSKGRGVWRSKKIRPKVFLPINGLKWRKNWSNLFFDTMTALTLVLLVVGKRGWGKTKFLPTFFLGTQDLRAFDSKEIFGNKQLFAEPPFLVFV